MTQLEFLERYGRCVSPDQEHNHVDPRSGFYASHGILRYSGVEDWHRPALWWERAFFLTWVRWRWFNGPRWGFVMWWTEDSSARLARVRFRFRATAQLVKWLLTTDREWFRLEIYDHLTGRLESERR